VFILPERDDCLESFQWMAQEIQQSKGEALVMKVERFEGLSEKTCDRVFSIPLARRITTNCYPK